MEISKFYKSLNQQQKVELAECLKNEGFETRNRSALIPEWIKIHEDLISTRLNSLLIQMYNYGYNYIDDVDKINFLRYRNAGIISWNEFVKIKNDLNSM